MVLAPVAVGDLWLVAASRGLDGHVLALDKHSGRVVWNYNAATSDVSTTHALNNILSQPLVWRDRALFRVGDRLTAVRLSDGSQIWTVPLDSRIRVPLSPSAAPSSDERAVYFNADFGIAYAFNPSDGKRLWSTATSAFQVAATLNVRRVDITFTFCSPGFMKRHIFVANGLGDIYALRAADGAILWQTHLGYPYHFVIYHTKLFVDTDQGFFQLEPDTGKILRQHLVPGGIVRCVIRNNQAVLTHAILPKIAGGWEVFDLNQWKRMSYDPGFACRYGIGLSGNMLILSGYDTQDPASIKTEVRAYRLPNATQP